MAMPATTAEDAPGRGIAFVVVAMACISLNDMLIKFLSGDYPLHQMIFARTAIGIQVSLLLVQLEGGWRILGTATPGLHLLRGLLVVAANMLFFMALAVLPLGTATALFFVGPLFITLLSVPFLGERVGPWRAGAVVVGFCGVLLMMLRGGDAAGAAAPLWVMALPVAAALCYAGMQIMTRRLGVTTKASALAVYIQGTFLSVSIVFYLAAGDGRFAEGVENESLLFLLRAWRWPEGSDWALFLLLGANSAVIGYSLSQAYRLGDAATIAPFEYVALPMAIGWGWLIWGELPGPQVAAGIALIAGAGIVVFLREGRRARPVAARRPFRRW